MILQNRCKINNKNSEIPIFYIIYYNGAQIKCISRSTLLSRTEIYK